MSSRQGTRNSRNVSKRRRARRLLHVEQATLTLYAAYLVVLIRLVVILFHSDFPHLG